MKFIFPLLFPLSLFADTISLVTDSWCPYSYKPDSKKLCILVEVAKEIFEKKGHKVTYTEINWVRAIREVRKGTYIGLVDAYLSDAPDFIFPKEHIMISKMCFFTNLKDSWLYKGLDFSQKKIGVIKGYSYGEKLDNYIKTKKDLVEINRLNGLRATP